MNAVRRFGVSTWLKPWRLRTRSALATSALNALRVLISVAAAVGTRRCPELQQGSGDSVFPEVCHFPMTHFQSAPSLFEAFARNRHKSQP